MKSNFYLLFCVLLMLGSVNVSAQIGIGTKTPAASAALDVSSSTNNKGILIPRLSATQKDAIVNPAEGLLVYQTTAPTGFYYYSGTAWKLMANATDLSAAGNAGTATKLAASKNINGVAFDGSADINAPAAAETLTGTTLKSTVTGSSLTSVGTLANLTVTNPIAGSITGNAGTVTTNANLTGPVTSVGNATSIADGAITNAKVTDVAATKITGTLPVANGGTGAATAAAARTSLELGNIDNTTDLLKPISTLTQTALNLKAPLASPTLTGTPLAPTATAGTNTTQIATTQFVTGAITAAGGVDLTTNQTIAGTKTFSSNISANGVSVGRGNGNNDESVAIGQGAMGVSNVNGKRNTAIGWGSLRSYIGTSWDNITSVGYNNLPSLTTGGGNTSVGAESFLGLTTGSQNTSVGNQSLINTNGDDNVGIGKRAGQTITTGSQNTIIGTNADVATAALSNASAIGYGASVSASNSIQLGNTAVTDVKTSGTITAGSISNTPIIARTYEAYNVTLSSVHSGSIIYSQHSSRPFFPENLPDGFQCTIVNYSNFDGASNSLTNNLFFTKALGNTGISSFTIKAGGTVNVNVVTIDGAKRYYISGDL